MNIYYNIAHIMNKTVLYRVPQILHFTYINKKKNKLAGAGKSPNSRISSFDTAGALTTEL